MDTKLSIEPKRLFKIILFSVFGFFVVLNFFTPLVCDDYAYLFSWKDGTKLTNILDIFPSMYAHAFSMNGRLVPHFFVQLFLLFPKPIFNVVNALAFTLMVFMICKISLCTGKRKLHSLMLLGIFCVIWYLEPAFGQVNLWVDGSCNYLWSCLFGIIYLYPYLTFWATGIPIKKQWILLGLALFSLMWGNYSENLSIAVMSGAFVILAASKYLKNFKIPRYLIVNLFLSAIGYIILFSSPAELTHKASSGGIQVYLSNFINIWISYFTRNEWLIIVWLLFIVMAVYNKIPFKKLFISYVFIGISLISNFMFIFASAYEQRSMCGSFIFLVCAVVYAMSKLIDTKYEIMIPFLCTIAIVLSMTQIVYGLFDIKDSYYKWEDRITYIEESKDNGQLDLSAPLILPATKYSALWGLRDLAIDTSNTWPNTFISKYYGINSIIGY